MKRFVLIAVSLGALVAVSLGASPRPAQAALASCGIHSLGVPDTTNPKHFTWDFRCSGDYRITFFLENDRGGTWNVANCQVGACAVAHPAAPSWFGATTEHSDTAGFNIVSPDTPVCNYRWRASVTVSFRNGDPVANYNGPIRGTC